MWTNRPIWPQGVPDPLPEQPIPETMAWDLWIGPAPMRPYNTGYAPFNWRGWWDFGCGALGDMACHIMDPAFWAMDLSEPASVECTYEEGNNNQTGPTKCTVKYEFPARKNRFAKQKMPAVDVYWYEGGLLPDRPEGVPADEKLGDGGNGSMFVGDNGVLTTGCYGDKTRLVPASDNKARRDEVAKIEPVIPRVHAQNHHRDWVRSCKDGKPAASNFEYAVPLTEMVLLGNLAVRSGQKVDWNASEMRVTNNVPNVEQYIRRDYRQGWTL